MVRKSKKDKKVSISISETNSKNKKNYLIILFIFLFSFLWRLLFIYSNIDKRFPFSVFYYGDSIKYHDYAMAILNGQLFDNGFPYHPPFLAWVIAAIYTIIGVPQKMGYSGVPYKIIYSIFNSIANVALYYLALNFVKRYIAIIICIIFAMSFGMFILSSTPNNENIYIIILLISVLLIVKNLPLNSVKASIGIGITNALAALTRAEHIFLFPVFLIYILINGKSSEYKKCLKYCAYALLFFLLTLMPWLIRNYKIINNFNLHNSARHLESISPFVLVTNYGALNFAMANNAQATGGFSRDLLNKTTGEAVLNFNNPQHRYYFIHGYEEGLKWIINNPFDYIKLCIKKLNISFDALALGFTTWNIPSGLNGIRHAVDVFAPENNWFRYIFLLAIIAGMILLLKYNIKKSLILYFILIHKLIVILLFFGYVRQLLSIYPVILIFLCYALEHVRENRLKTLLGVVLIVASISFLIDLSMISKVKNYIVSGYTDPATVYIIQDSIIKIKLKRN